MNKGARLTARATPIAEKILRDEEIESLPVDPSEIAESRDIVIQAKPDTEPGVSGMLLRHGDSFGILYATHIPSIGFQRFSIAHELGHYFLPGHIDHILPGDGAHSSRAGFVTNDPYELEADHFAAGLLMPSDLFKRELRKLDPGLGAVEILSELCCTSLTATAIRYAQLSEDAIAVIVSTGVAVDYCFMSDAMKSLSNIDWIKKGALLPLDTVTAKLAGDTERVLKSDRAEDELDVQIWLGGTRSTQVTEEVVGLGELA